jgi:hypothetical protein
VRKKELYEITLRRMGDWKNVKATEGKEKHRDKNGLNMPS